MQATMTTTSLDELVSLWGDVVNPVLVPDPEWTVTRVLDCALNAQLQIKVFAYMGADLIPHRVGLFGDEMVALDELVRLWGPNVSLVFPDPESPVPESPDLESAIEDALYIGLARTEIQIQLFEYTGADGILHRVGLLGEEAVSQDVKSKVSSLDDFLRLLGNEDEGSAVVQELIIKEVLEFALTATEKQIKFFYYTGTDGTPDRVGLWGKDVRQGVLVVSLLGEEWHPTVHRQTLMCLANLAVSHEKQVMIASLPGVLPALVRLLLAKDTVDPSVLEQTARCLCQLAFARENQVKLTSHPGVLDAMVCLMLEAESADVLEQTAECLTHLTESRINQVKIVSHPGALTAVVRLLGRSGISNVREQTLKCLTNLTVLQEYQVKIVSYPDLLGALLRLLGNKETTKVQWQSAKCLTNLADHYQENKVDIASYPGVLDTLVRLLKYNWGTTERISVQEQSATLLVVLASAYQNLVKIAFHPGMLDALVSCLGKYAKQSVQDLAAECLRDLAAVPENQGKIVNHPGVLAAILRMLVQVVNPSEQAVAAWCLYKLATTQETKVIIVSHRGMLDALVRLLKESSNSATLQPTIRCMVALVQLTNRQVQIACHPGLLEALVKVLEEDVDSSDLEQAARCLSLLALAPENQGTIVSYPGALDALVALLTKDRKAGVLEQTAQLLTNLAEYQDNQMKIASFPGILQRLVFLLSKNVKPSVQMEVVTCLVKLSESQGNLVKITSCPGAVDALMRLATRNGVGLSAHAREQAGRCLANLDPADKYGGFSIGGQATVMQRRVGQSHPSLAGRDSSSYLDPLTNDIMCDPVKCTDGKTYDRWTILDPNISFVRHSSYSNFSRATVSIEMDDMNMRRRLFEAFPQQQEKFSARRLKYQVEALQHAHMGEFEDAVEKLNNVLKWTPLDIECQNELERIHNVLEQSIDPDRWDMDPLTYDRMCDPVKCNDGRTYDRWTIIENNLVRCPYDSNLKYFGIVVDDLNIRRRLFEEFPDQEAILQCRRTRYRDEALQLASNGEVENAIKKLRNVLKWAPSDRTCRREFKRSLNRLREQNFKICVLEHEDLVREMKRTYIAEMTPPVIVLLLAMGIWLIIESGWLTCRDAISGHVKDLDRHQLCT